MIWNEELKQFEIHTPKPSIQIGFERILLDENTGKLYTIPLGINHELE